MLFYPAALPLSAQTLSYVAGVIRRHRRQKTWRILRKLRCCPWRAGQLAKAIHVL
jgi:hypothetical protein